MTHVHVYPAPAKLNLFLHVCGRRSDGYHLIESAFQLIDLCDELRFTLRTDSKIVRTNDLAGIPEADDLILRAANMLASHIKQKMHTIVPGVNISVTKRIPMGAGLGGGSSDAATTLLALNELWQCHLSKETLMTIGEQLGADVPFFIFGKNAFVQGIGEQLQPLKIPECWFVIIHPSVFVSTSEIFHSKSLTRNTKPTIIAEFPDACREINAFGKNDLQPVATSLYPQIQQAIDDLNQFSKARMTGSGSCVFSCFETQEQATAVADELATKWKTWVVKSLQKHPLLHF